MKKKKTQEKPGLVDYLLTDNAGSTVKLSSLFGKEDYLIILHNMGKSCPTCIVYGDEFNGARQHLQKHASFCSVGPDDWHTQKLYLKERGWQFPLYSSKGTTFGKDLGFESENGDAQAGVSILTKKPRGPMLILTQMHALPGRVPSVVDVLDSFDILRKQK